MKINKLLNIILIVFTSCSAQNERIENKLMECYYQSFSDGGIELKQLIINYENLLINESILDSNSAKSYIKFLQNFAERNESFKTPSKFFCVEEQKIKRTDQNKLLECRKIILADSTSYDNSKLEGLKKAIVDNAKPYNTVKDMLKVLLEEDFEIDYYKRQAFLVFCLIDTEAGVKK